MGKGHVKVNFVCVQMSAVSRRWLKKKQSDWPLKVRLASQDGASVLKWMGTLWECGHYVEIKASSDDALSGSGLNKNAFMLIIQMKYQQECWKKHGGHFAGIDVTHNTTHYENISLFMLLVHDK